MQGMSLGHQETQQKVVGLAQADTDLYIMSKGCQ
jgi:hypothetical protein